MATSYFTQKQRQELILSYMGSYSDWYNDEPTVYSKPEVREQELNTLNNSELFQLIKSEIPALLNLD